MLSRGLGEDGEWGWHEYFQPAQVVLLASYTYETVRLLLVSKSKAYPLLEPVSVVGASLAGSRGGPERSAPPLRNLVPPSRNPSGGCT